MIMIRCVEVRSKERRNGSPEDDVRYICRHAIKRDTDNACMKSSLNSSSYSASQNKSVTEPTLVPPIPPLPPPFLALA